MVKTNKTADGDSKKKKAAVINPEFNPFSRYEEGAIAPYLTLYDIERKPRDTTNKMCKQPLNNLNTMFHCPVCLGYMKKTFIVMECLHRFCGECIQKCLRLGKKECPSCRVHIPSRRSLRPDLNYDAIVKKMFGDIEALENSEDKEIESWNKRNNMNNAYTERRTREISKQAKNRKKAVKQQPLRQSPIESLPVPVDRGVGLISGGIRNLTESNLIDFVLRIHPQEKGIQRLHRECIRTSGDITIEHLKRFLGRKLAYEHYHHFQIITPLVSGKQVVLDDQMTLREIRNQISDRRRGEVLMLQYRRHIL
jgi:E3 ubiquitin-protein ligase RNF1/2